MTTRIVSILAYGTYCTNVGAAANEMVFDRLTDQAALRRSPVLGTPDETRDQNADALLSNIIGRERPVGTIPPCDPA
jgi:hypothetical protein